MAFWLAYVAIIFYFESMTLKRTSHAAYDCKYHLVWAPKYRKWIDRKDIRDRRAELFYEIATRHDFDIDKLQVSEDHVHIFLSFPPRYSISKVVGMLESISASVIFKGFPEIKCYLWGGEFWEDGYFVRTIGDEVTAEVIQRYIEHHRHNRLNQLELF